MKKLDGIAHISAPLHALTWLIAGLGLVIFPHVPRLPWWVSVSFALLAGWRGLAALRNLRLPNTWLLFLFSLLIFAGVLLTYRTVFGRDAGVALLVGLIGVKLMELKTRRDAIMAIFLGYFLVITNFLYSQDILMVFYLFGVVVIMTGALISLSDRGNALSLRQRLRLSATMLVQATPVMLVLFVFFPRVEGPFWGLPRDAFSGLSGLSDSMSPGDINKLSLSDAVAFRVKFNGEVPPSGKLYWRGPVLLWTDGRTWRAPPYLAEFKRPVLQAPARIVEYAVTLEPHNQPWLYALEMPLDTPPKSFFSLDYQLRLSLPARERQRYTVRSALQFEAIQLSKPQRDAALRLPYGKHPRARALAEQWRQQNPQPQALVEQALRYFNTEPFVYTLEPARLDKDPVDEFLFDTREGFCEHYASAFTTLMRLAGVPARVVTGYQGGEMNPFSGYLVVRQYDAHAWSEVWLEGRGWVRIDPTSAVSPSRIERGMESALPQRFAPLGLQLQRDSALFHSLQWMRNRWDAVNSGWNEWVLGYSPLMQQDVLDGLGLDGWGYQGLAAVLAALVGGLLAAVAAWMALRGLPPPAEPALRLYRRFCRRLEKRGLARRPSEGPLDFAARATAALPRHAEAIAQIIRLYVEIRYHNPSGHKLKSLASAVRRFRP